MMSIPLWVASYLRWLDTSHAVDLLWHTHEMVFGFAAAVIVGFLYTAGRNWTGLWTPRGMLLASIAGCWLIGRLGMLFAGPVLSAVLDLAFLPIAAWPLYRVLVRSQNRRNLGLIGILALLWIANLAFHASALGWLDWNPIDAVKAATLLIVLLITVIGGRVIPPFTTNVIKEPRALSHAAFEPWVIASTLLAIAAWASHLYIPGWLLMCVMGTAAASHLIRMRHWQTSHVWKHPLLWILHLSYFCIPLGLLSLGLAATGIWHESVGIHILAVGAMSGMIIGMMTRTALGHTGRPLIAGKAEISMYGLMVLAVVFRITAAISSGEWRITALSISMLCWSLVFALYIFVYGPYLVQARTDGLEG